MAWTSPITWAAGVLTSSALNQQVRDNFKAIGDPWTAYTPVWTAASVNPAVGNGSLVGRYLSAGKLTMFSITLTMGTTTTYGTGQWQFTLPTTPQSSARRPFMLDMSDATVADYSGVARWINASSKIFLYCAGTTAGGGDRVVQSNQPFTWGNTDALVIHGAYESA